MKQIHLQYFNLLSFGMLSIILVLLNACDRWSSETKVTVTTLDAKDITDNSVTIEYDVEINGSSYDVNYYHHSIVYNTESGVNLENSSVATKGEWSSGSYNTQLEDLYASTTYYYRAYIEDGYGAVVYGEEKSFKTLAHKPPTVTTLTVISIGSTTATLRGNIEFEGRPAYTEKGMCYGTAENPTVNNQKIIVSGSSTGNYTAFVSGLSSGTTYYVRAYAINTKGTAYGEQVSFITTSASQNNTQVRFRKEKTYEYATVMDVSNSSGTALASYNFGTSAGTSPFYIIEAGVHTPWFYYSEPGNAGWRYCLSNPNTYNFLAGYKYTVVCSDDGTYLMFFISNEGAFSAPANSFKPAPELSTKPKNITESSNIKCKATGTWIGQTKYEYEWNAYGKNSQYIKYEWDLENNNWVNVSKTEYNYDSMGNRISTVCYYWEERWVEEEKYEFDWDLTYYMSDLCDAFTVLNS